MAPWSECENIVALSIIKVAHPCNRGTALKEKVELDRTHTKEKQHCNNQTGTNMEPTRQAEQRKTQKHLEKEHRARSEGTDVETAGEDGARQAGVESIHQWPMFRKE